MSSSTAPTQEGGVRLVSGTAHVMQMDGTEGRTLFPSTEFSHWPPFETLAERTMVGSGAPDPHPHTDQEVVNYVLSGTLLIYDETHRCTEVPTGSVSLLDTRRMQVHDVNPASGTTAHWLALVLHLPPGTAEPKRAHQIAPAAPLASLPSGVEGSSVVGLPGRVLSILGLEMWDVRFRESSEVVLPVPENRTALVYVLEGGARAADRDLPRGGGLQAEGLPKLPVQGEPGSRLMYASVLRNP